MNRLPQDARARADEQRIGAAILLGIIAHTDRTAIDNDAMLKRVAEALTAIVEDKTISARHRAGAAEILGQAYVICLIDVVEIYIFLHHFERQTRFSKWLVLYCIVLVTHLCLALSLPCQH